ncbi:MULTISPECIES: EscU/YscU/HrcU family type III secretion system export apparatus switch protein [Alcaligenes]|jgi:flagellar biosynthesis protein|uniref:EscU/YscU/HrcU family type III secretion system export apparatus switch protein n=1 Tax=Alcaligenes aquatilis TaxID=323284 RepID=A0ABY4NKI6_9BURK|nr:MULTISPECIES: EscU/YscU/HrcU family type III secretion system export apparatus switch protein [Alcaligenes]AWG33963.1 flagellar biosynthesis protein FlhB [Alcaligenes aquatilis]MCC9163263.1 EscU/YscU/HrcU family type III secretion system export apparatus switch protein [Alcaligenes sp. MMA]MCH4225755.1 EscU/YscU/HrcU family type III secretion system export apparatus switch protein [Alcaligenes faecalis]UQN37146.1 EscU/YscU/HrcU family type III secretion system export apparatus switch protein
MSHDVPTPRPQALALRYDPQDGAPRVVAKGYGTLAEKIIETAREHNLYVHESPELVGLLMQVDLDRHIPPQLYQAVAELLAWLYALEQGHPQATQALQALHDASKP